MATVTKPMALDESFNTTENTSRNVADVLAEGLSDIADAISPKYATDLPMSTTEPNSMVADRIEACETAIDNATKYKVGDTIDLSGLYLCGQPSNGRYRFLFTIPLPKSSSGLAVTSATNFSCAFIYNGNYITVPSGLTITFNASGSEIGLLVTLYFSQDFTSLTLDSNTLIRIISGTITFVSA